MPEHEHQFFAVLIATVVLGRAKGKRAMRDMVSKIAHELKCVGRKFLRAGIDSAYCSAMLRFVSIE
ncbi:hypothetical protein APA66_16365 [Pseudomonas aeruginosa]|nr:hypothetical protein AO916_16095 [Pseudomonas aeruginosa]KSM51941.1 hypothetical protein APA66_16365 [Pseudomonas aeruginosa]KUG32325.1 hypothetical protein AUQ38_07850 [Pseudomonas aeruginosa]OXT91667.1 hypothetical protein CF339_07275 [Pseudomonas aeruginosa]RQC61061.1 hypothetical protein IPC364_10365 [Pseudomonas aeruginosa]